MHSTLLYYTSRCKASLRNVHIISLRWGLHASACSSQSKTLSNGEDQLKQSCLLYRAALFPLWRLSSLLWWGIHGAQLEAAPPFWRSRRHWLLHWQMQCGQEDMERGQHPTHQGKTAQGGHLLQHSVNVFVISLYWLIYNMHNIIPKLNFSLWRLEVWQLGQCISLGSMELIWLDWVMVRPPALPSNARLGPCLTQVM